MKIYKLMADAHREAGDANEHRLKALDFLATCDEEDIRALFNSGAFNVIVSDAVEYAIDGMTKEQHDRVMDRLEKAMDDIAAE